MDTVSNANTIEEIGCAATDQTALIQAALDRAAGGGCVRLLPGVHRSGMLRLPSCVTLEIAGGAVLKALEEPQAFPAMQSSRSSRMDMVPWKAFLHADGQRDIRLCGSGTIDGSGGEPCFRDGVENSPNRPYGLHFIACTNVVVEDLTLRDSAFWMQRYFACAGVRLRRLRVWNHANRNNDGIDIDSSRDVEISDCEIDASDDALCIKSEGEEPARDIRVSNCLLATHASAFKLGTGSVGGFENIHVRGLRIRRSASTEMLHPLGRWGGISGIDLASTDGGPLRNIDIAEVDMEGLDNAIFMRLGNRRSGHIARQGYGGNGDAEQGVKANGSGVEVHDRGVFAHVRLAHITARDVGPWPVVVAGHAGAPIHDVALRDVAIHCGRPGTRADLETEPDWTADRYPGIGMFGTALPAYGIVARFVENLSIENFAAHPAPGEFRPERWIRP